MAKTTQEELINQLIDRVNKHIETAVKIFQNLDGKTLKKPASNGGWGIAECLWHLNSYGDFYLPAIEKAIANAANKPSSGIFKGSWIGSYFTRMMEPKTGKKKMKAFKNHRPPQVLDAHAVVAEFIRQQEQMLVLLEKAKKVDLDSVKTPISISHWVKLKLGDVFQFCVAHDERHVVQAMCNL